MDVNNLLARTALYTLRSLNWVTAAAVVLLQASRAPAGGAKPPPHRRRTVLISAPIRHKAQELGALSEPTLAFVGVTSHLTRDAQDRSRTQVEIPVKVSHRIEDLATADLRVLERCLLHAVAVHQQVFFQPAVGLCLRVQL